LARKKKSKATVMPQRLPLRSQADLVSA
jgi:hypothetical protein